MCSRKAKELSEGPKKGGIIEETSSYKDPAISQKMMYDIY